MIGQRAVETAIILVQSGMFPTIDKAILYSSEQFRRLRAPQIFTCAGIENFVIAAAV